MYAVFFIWVSLKNSCLQNANIFVLSVSNIWVGQKGQVHKILNFYINSDSIFSLWILYEISCLLWSTRIYLVLMVSEIKGGPTPKIITFFLFQRLIFVGFISLNPFKETPFWKVPHRFVVAFMFQRRKRTKSPILIH